MRLPLAALLLPALALAQTGELVRPPLPTRGVTLPPTSLALTDEASASVVNPAALGWVGGPQLLYLHERNRVRDTVADALFTSSQLLGVVGLGFGVEWMRGRPAPDYRRTTFGLSLGGPSLSLGAAHHRFASNEDERTDRLSTWDFALATRPSRVVAVSAAVRDVDAREEDGLVRRWGLGLGLRPLGNERLTLGADLFTRGSSVREGRLSYALHARLVRGLTLSGGLSHGLRSGEEWVAQAALTVDSAHLGLTYAGGGSLENGPPDTGLDHVVAVRLSARPYPALRLTPGTVALLDLDDLLSSRTSPLLGVLGFSETDPYLRLLRLLERAAEDDTLEGVLVKFQGLPDVGWGRGEELRRALARLQQRGKRVVAVLFRADDVEYYVASVADEVYALPESTLLINGLAASVTSLGGTMEKLGVSWDVARVGEYKTAPETLTRRDMSPAQRETLEAYLDSQVKHYEERVTAARRLPAGRLREAWAQGILTAARAQELGLVDGVLDPSALDEKVKQLVPGARYAAGYRARREREGRWAPRRQVAVVPVLGTITGGKSREDFTGGGRVAGAETVVRALERARRDPGVVAIVLRVDSPGGEVLASDLMHRAVLEAGKAKPVVASMGDLAASGGYYAAMGAHEILASPTTLTGSIGVFFLKPAVRELGERLGVNQETLKRAPLADLTSLWAPWGEAQRAAAQAWVDASYDTFISAVATSRRLEKAKVDAVARGRVWSGADAHARGLVDGFGGLAEALQAARRRAHVPADEETDVVVLGEPGGLFAPGGGEPGVLARLLPPPAPVLPPAVRALAEEVGLGGGGPLLTPGLQATLPFRLEVR